MQTLGSADRGLSPSLFLVGSRLRISRQGVSLSLTVLGGVIPTRMVYLCNDIKGFRPEWSISAMISRVSDQNSVSQA